MRAETRPALTLHCQGNIVPDEPLDLPSNQALVIRIESINGNTLAEESALTLDCREFLRGPPVFPPICLTSTITIFMACRRRTCRRDRAFRGHLFLDRTFQPA